MKIDINKLIANLDIYDLNDLKKIIDHQFYLKVKDSKNGIDSLNISCRLYNILKYNNIKTIDELKNMQLNKYKGIGKKSRNEIIELLNEINNNI
jgi:DNA-directed RNA polymerase alpha subunit